MNGPQPEKGKGETSTEATEATNELESKERTSAESREEIDTTKNHRQCVTV